MVATRNHPTDFQDDPPAPTPPPPEPSPRKRNTTVRQSTTAMSTTNATSASKTSNGSPSKPTSTPRTSQTSTSTSTYTRTTPRSTPRKWSHTPSTLTLFWLAVSLPLVIWDTGYALLRPWTMEGGFLHAPLWKPYKLYGEVDHAYGWIAYNRKEGWTSAQASLNALETMCYMWYLYLVWTYGVQEKRVQGRGAPDLGRLDKLGLRVFGESRTVQGKVAAWATVVAYTTAQITFWKTVLYWGIEFFNGFQSIGHNSWSRLFWLWIVPNGAWLVVPAYMIYVFGGEILQGLEIAAGGSAKRH